MVKTGRIGSIPIAPTKTNTMSDTDRIQQLSSEIIAIQTLIEFYWEIPTRDRAGDYGEVVDNLNYKVENLRIEYFNLIT